MLDGNLLTRLNTFSRPPERSPNTLRTSRTRFCCLVRRLARPSWDPGGANALVLSWSLRADTVAALRNETARQHGWQSRIPQKAKCVSTPRHSSRWSMCRVPCVSFDSSLACRETASLEGVVLSDDECSDGVLPHPVRSCLAHCPAEGFVTLLCAHPTTGPHLVAVRTHWW